MTVRDASSPLPDAPDGQVGLADSGWLARAAPDHYDELFGKVWAGSAEPAPVDSATIAPQPDFAAPWHRFFENTGITQGAELNLRATNLERQIRDNGVTYNVYAEEGGPQRPWSLDLFPLIISPRSWQQVEAGVLQRVRLLDQLMGDVYGPQRLLAQGLLPAALVQGHPGYLRAMHGVRPAGGTHLHIAAFDMARGPDGNWWVVSQRTQAPSGLGYLLENRLGVSRLFPQAFEKMQVQRLAGTYRALVDSMKRMAPGGEQSHIALLTPGPYNETYFEHAYLARYLGLSLVEGNDLMVRDQRLYLKTLKGLVPVHGLLKRLDDQFLDPLELRADSTLGVPGLLQVIRAGNVLLANAPGSAFLESPALLGFLPALARSLLGEELSLPALPTWWCGERSAMEEVLPQLQGSAIKPTYPGSQSHGDFDAVLGRSLSPRELEEWAGRIALNSDDHTVQAYMPLSQMPTWQAQGDSGRIVPRSLMLRVFAVSDGPQSWRVLPGGLVRVAGSSPDIASMQRGGSSADCWVMTNGSVDRTTLLPAPLTASALAHRSRVVTSRSAENLYWLGRYTERAENSTRLARLTLECLSGEDQSSPSLLTWLGRLAVGNALVLPDVPAPLLARRVFERSLIAGLDDGEASGSVAYTLRSVRQAGSAVRDRLSQEHWNMILRCERELRNRAAAQGHEGEYSSLEALRALKAVSHGLAAITGAQTDRMTRDDGWRLLSIGRHIERLGFLAQSLAHGFETGSVLTDGGFEAMLSLFDSSITFHAQYQQSRDVAALLDLLVLDRDNPRSLGWVANTLRARLAKLAGAASDSLGVLSLRVPDPMSWGPEQLCESQPPTEGDGPTEFPVLEQVLQDCVEAAWSLSDDISAVYFTHSGEAQHILAA